MVRVWEHVHRLNSLHLITVFAKESQIPCLSFNVTGNINNLFGLESSNTLKEGYITAGSGRIHKYNVNLFLCLSHTHHKLACIGAEKSDILCLVKLCVHYGITHGILVKLNTDNLLGLVKSHKADCTDTAISIEDSFLARKTCKLDSSTVKLLCLHGVNLIE